MVWLSDTTALGKNPKLTPKWLGPYKIVDLNENNVKLKIKQNKFKIINISRLKAFHEDTTSRLSQDNLHLSQGNPSLFQDSHQNFPQRPMTRALKKLIDYKNAATMAISILHHEIKQIGILTLSLKTTLNIVVISVSMASKSLSIQTFMQIRKI
jgi:hypothetical protein